MTFVVEISSDYCEIITSPPKRVLHDVFCSYLWKQGTTDGSVSDEMTVLRDENGDRSKLNNVYTLSKSAQNANTFKLIKLRCKTEVVLSEDDVWYLQSHQTTATDTHA